MVTLDDGFVDRIVIVEFDEGEPLPFSGLFVGGSSHGNDGPELFEVSFDLLIFNFFGDSSDENLLDGLSGVAIVPGLTRCGALRLNLLSVDDVGSVLLTSVDLFVGGVGHEAESARPFGVWELHDYTID